MDTDYRKKWREKNREHANAYSREWKRRNKDKVRGYRRKTKKKRQRYAKEYYLKHREEFLKRAKRNQKKRRKRMRKLKIKYVILKGGKCETCGYDKNLGALEFHHPDGTSVTVRERRGLEFPQAKLFDLDVVDLLCSNCHREEHHSELNNWKQNQ